ncbi:MAG: hypothetical protein RML95_08625 [Anaerolineae bacterium]|nr:hypothetical protein [Anaerolineae bacterium]
MRWIALWTACLCLAACQAQAPSFPTSTPTFDVPSPTADAQSAIWLEQPFGGGTLAIYFYSVGSRPCLRFLTDLPSAQPVSACAQADVPAIVAQGVVQDASGQPHTIIAVRALRPEVSVVVIELRNGESYPLEIEESGALLILPGALQAWRAVPIDSFGNIVGTLLRLSE